MSNRFRSALAATTLALVIGTAGPAMAFPITSKPKHTEAPCTTLEECQDLINQCKRPNRLDYTAPKFDEDGKLLTPGDVICYKPGTPGY